MLKGLNPEQRVAVVETEGPLLVIAGAGSGKTRVLTTRIAHLLQEKGVRPENVLAFTFTNKAAKEMRERVERLVPQGDRCWIGTFHATGVRILRREAELLGYPRSFSIYDADDSRAVIKNILKSRKADPKQFSPRDVAASISRFKNASKNPEQVRSEAYTVIDERLGEFYGDYDKALRTNQAMDFDDLIVKTVELLENHRDVQERYSRHFRYVLVDEFQDTNPLQLILTKALSSHHGNLFAVGDDDQSIYSWRGATVENMLNFEDYFPGAQVLRLERNYRSTGTILKAANAVISCNVRRRGKELWTDAGAGEKLELWWAQDEEDEASLLGSRIDSLLADGEFRRNQTVILYRTNAQSRALEDALRRSGTPYQIVGGTRFYERKEVRDVLAYLKLVANPADAVSLARIINVPRRGIGKTTVERLMEAAARHELSPLSLCARPDLLLQNCGKAASGRLSAFARLIGDLQRLAENADAARVLTQVLDATGYVDHLKNEGDGEDPVEKQRAIERQENVHELLNAAHSFVAESDEGRLADFLESVALLADVDRMEDESDMVTLMTMHNAKGLEFPVVFVAGCEEDLLPHANSQADADGVEEERRLFYVALTRGQKRVFLSSASARRRFGGFESMQPSRFLSELPADCVEERGERHEIVSVPSWGQTARGAGIRGAAPLGSGRHRKGRQKPSEEGDGAWAGAYSVEAFRKSQARRKASSHGFEAHELNQEERSFVVGMNVRHGALGEGRIEAVEGFGELTKLTISFGDSGRKRILARYADLEILDGGEAGEAG